MRFKLHNKSSKITSEMCENIKGAKKIKVLTGEEVKKSVRKKAKSRR